MSISNTASWIILACFAGPAFAAEIAAPSRIGKSQKPLGRAISDGSSPVNFRISFTIRAGEVSSSGNFVVKNGNQVNYVRGGDTPIEVKNSRGDKGVEFKKHGTIVNCLPTADPNGTLVHAECQFELSGPGKPETSLQVHPVATFQIQSSFVARKGQPLVLVDEPDRRIEVKIEDAGP